MSGPNGHHIACECDECETSNQPRTNPMKIDTGNYTVTECNGVITLTPIEDKKDIGWTPKYGTTYWHTVSDGAVREEGFADDEIDERTRAFGNMFPTKALAEKAAKLMARSNQIISACLEIDPGFDPDWSDGGQKKHTPYFSGNSNQWGVTDWMTNNHVAACVSTKEKCIQVCSILTARGIK